MLISSEHKQREINHLESFAPFISSYNASSFCDLDLQAMFHVKHNRNTRRHMMAFHHLHFKIPQQSNDNNFHLHKANVSIQTTPWPCIKGYMNL